jgi:pilus assembly protein CpaF
MSNNWNVDDVNWTPPKNVKKGSKATSDTTFNDDDFGGIDNSDPDNISIPDSQEKIESSESIQSVDEDHQSESLLKEIEDFGISNLDYIVKGKSKEKNKKRKKEKNHELEVDLIFSNEDEVLTEKPNSADLGLDSLFLNSESNSEDELPAQLNSTNMQNEVLPENIEITTHLSSLENAFIESNNPQEIVKPKVTTDKILPDNSHSASIDSLFSNLDEPENFSNDSANDLGNMFTQEKIGGNFAEDRSSKFTSWDIDRKAHEFARLWPTVELLTRASQSDIEIQKIVPEMLLTRDLLIDSLQKKQLQDLLRFKIGAAGISIPNPDDSTPILDIAYDEMLGISVLGDLWRDNDITEIMVDRWDRITVERNGKLEITPITFRNQQHAESVARNLALRISDRALSSSIPLVTAELPDARITFAFGSVVKGRISITLRKFRALLNLDELMKRKSLNEEMVKFLKDAVASRAGILVSGGTGTGKTTIINLLSTFIPTNERVITIEDAFELNIAAEHVVSLQTKEASSRDDQINVTLADLMRNTLRMRPDRIIVGEIREGEGASVMLAAANTGHDGTMTTIHASSAELALNERLVDLVRDVRNSSDEAIKRTIISAFEVVVQVSRGRKGQRYLSEIAIVDSLSMQNGNIKPTSLFIGEEQLDGTIQHRKVGKIEPGSNLQLKLALAGIPEDRW